MLNNSAIYQMRLLVGSAGIMKLQSIGMN